MTDHRACNKSNATGGTCGAWTAYPSVAHVEHALFTLPWHMSSTPFYNCFSEVYVVQITYLHVRRLVLWSTFRFPRGPGWLNELDYLTTHTSLSPMRRGFAPGFVNYKKGCTQLAAASDKAYQLLPHGRWYSPGTPASSTTKTGRHDIAEILLKVALNTKNK
jgi:hypothetical protein